MGAFLRPYQPVGAIPIIFFFARVTFMPAAGLIGLWFLTQLFNLGIGDRGPDRRSGLHRSRGRCRMAGANCAFLWSPGTACRSALGFIPTLR